MTPAPSHRHILIDFENVPKIDLTPIAGVPVEVTLLLGVRNKQLGVDLVDQLLATETRTHLVQVGASGRNALDITLAFYLGHAVAEQPRAEFFIISRDKDYDVMIAHLKRNGVRVSRHEDVDTLPFLVVPTALPSPPAKTQSRPPARATSMAAAAPQAPVRSDDRFALVAKHLANSAHSRPKRRSTLLRHVKARLDKGATDADVAAAIDRLVERGVLAISDKDSVSYPS